MIQLASHFLRQKYPLRLIQEAAALERNKDRNMLLNTPDPSGEGEEDKKIFLITTSHPHDTKVPTIVRKNWNILGRNQTNQTLYQQKLTCGYRRPNNLRNILCKAALQRVVKDNTADRFYVAPPLPSNPPEPQQVTRQKPRQMSMLELVRPNKPPVVSTSASNTDVTLKS